MCTDCANHDPEYDDTNDLFDPEPEQPSPIAEAIVSGLCFAQWVVLLALGWLSYADPWVVVIGWLAPSLYGPLARRLLPNPLAQIALHAAPALIAMALGYPSIGHALATGLSTAAATGVFFAFLGAVTRFSPRAYAHARYWWDTRDARAELRAHHRAIEDQILAANIPLGLEQVEKWNKLHAPIHAQHTLAHMAGEDEPRQIIGLSGYAGSGKDTAAAGLIFGRDFTRVSFADKLREFALACDPLIVIDNDCFTWGPQWENLRHEVSFWDESERVAFAPLSVIVDRLDWTEAKRIVAVREFLQRLGTEAGRKVLGENIWVDAVMTDLPPGNLVFTDVRFPNEAQAIRDAGGWLVRIERPGVAAVNAHISDTALDGWDFDGAVVNDSTPAEARRQLCEVADQLCDPTLHEALITYDTPAEV